MEPWHSRESRPGPRIRPPSGRFAEEVAEAFPELVVYDAEGRPETVKYHVLSTLLVNELQRERLRGEERDEQLRRLVAERDERLQSLETEVAELRRANGRAPGGPRSRG